MAPTSVFASLPSQAHDEKVCAAVAEILRGNGPAASVPSIDIAIEALVLAVAGRIYLLPDIWLPPDVQVPCITIGPASLDLVNLTGGELENAITVRTSVIYNEHRASIANTDQTVRSAFKIIRSAIYDNYTLRVSAFSLVPLVKRIVRVNPITFDLFTAGDPFQVPRVQTLEFVFEKNLVSSTGDAS